MKITLNFVAGALTSILAGSAGQLLFKMGVGGKPLTVGSLFNLYVILGFVAYLVGTLSWLWVLSFSPVGIAYPVFSLNYVTVMLGAAVIFGEPITVTKGIGLLLILSGVWVLFRGVR